MGVIGVYVGFMRLYIPAVAAALTLASAAAPPVAPAI